MNDFYVYFHINPVTNQIFYVGKGKGKRAFNKNKRNIFWKRIVKKYGWAVDIVKDNLSNEEALELEMFYIKKIGRDKLCNLTDGGEGSLGYVATEETRKKLSEVTKGKKHSTLTKQKMSEIRKGKKMPQSFVEKLKKERIGEGNPMFGKLPVNSKKVINVETGEIYETIKEAAIKNNLNKVTLQDYLSGKRTNKTALQYYKNN